MLLPRFITASLLNGALALLVSADLEAQDPAQAPAQPQPADPPLAKATEVQSKLEQWVKTRQLISEESSRWAAEKATLSGLNEVRLRESAQLDEFIAAAGTRVTEIEEKRKAFVKEETDLKAWRAEMERQVRELEGRVRPLLPRLPAPLRAKVEEAAIRIETPDPDHPLQNRSRDLLLVLQAYLDFQNTLTVESDLREIGGARREVEILYLGLAQAWYVDAEGKHSGYGIPSDTGWVWTEDNSIASRVRTAIDVQARRATPTFVELPLAPATPAATPESNQ